MEIVASILGFTVAIGIVLPLIWLYSAVTVGLPGALFLRMACSLLGEPNPTYWKAVKLTTAVFWLQAGLGLIAGLVSAVLNAPALMLLSLVSLPLSIKLYAHGLELRYSRAVVVVVTQLLAVFLGVGIGVGVFHATAGVYPSLEQFLMRFH